MARSDLQEKDPMDAPQVPVQEAALLVIDAQDSFKIGARWERRNNLDFERNADRLVQAFRDAGLPVFYFLHTDADEHFRPGSPSVRLMDFLSPRPEEPVLTKNTRNCFTSTNLQDLLRERGVRRLAITGIQMEQCCETTARLAADLGYDVDFVIDATMTFPIQNPENGDELSTDDIRRRTEFVLRRRFARIVPTETLVAELSDERAEKQGATPVR
jgi:nicotinamidase-related amidase